MSPLTTSCTVPLTGEVRMMSGFLLSAKTGDPARTLSPSLTRRRGVNPLKSVGFTATMSGTTVPFASRAASPLIGMSSPFFKSMMFDIIIIVLDDTSVIAHKDSLFFAIF